MSGEGLEDGGRVRGTTWVLINGKEKLMETKGLQTEWPTATSVF